MIEIIALRSRLNYDMATLTANTPQFVVKRKLFLVVVDMTHMAAAVVGCFFAHNRTAFYATDIIDL